MQQTFRKINRKVFVGGLSGKIVSKCRLPLVAIFFQVQVPQIENTNFWDTRNKISLLLEASIICPFLPSVSQFDPAAKIISFHFQNHVENDVGSFKLCRQ